MTKRKGKLYSALTFIPVRVVAGVYFWPVYVQITPGSRNAQRYSNLTRTRVTRPKSAEKLRKSRTSKEARKKLFCNFYLTS